jgi:hypothetical protein
MWKKSKVMSISRQPSLIQIDRSKQLVNVEYIKYWDIVIINDAKDTSKVKFRISMAKAASSKNKALLTNRLYLNLRKQLVKCCVWIIVLYGAET